MRSSRPRRRTTEELLAATPADPAAFAEFYDRHERAVFVFLARRTRRADLAADLTAELLALAADRATAAGGASTHEGRPDDGVPAVHAPRQRSRDGRSAVGRVPSAGEGVARPWFRRPRRALAALAVGGVAAVTAIMIVGPGGEVTVPTPVQAGAAPGGATVPARTVRQAQTEFAVFRGSAKPRPASSPTPGKATRRASADGNLFALFPTPDGVATATFLLRDGTTREEPVHDNAVAVVSVAGVRGVRFVDASGKQQTVRF